MASDSGEGRRGDDGLTSGPPPFSDEGMRRIIYGQERGSDSRGAAFDEDTAELEAGLKGRRNLVPIVTALAAVVCFGAIVWYAYTWGTGQMDSEELPVVRAEPMPEKEKPAQPGGMDVPYQDKQVLNDGAASEATQQVERLLPAPETPQPPEPLESPAETAGAGGEAPLSQEAAETPQIVEAPAEIPVPPAESTATAEAPDETAPDETAISKPVPKPQGTASGGGDQIAELLEQDPLETADGGTAKDDEPAPTQTAALTDGDVVLQLSSVKSEVAAGQEWSRLQKAHPDQLGARKLSLETAEVKGTTYYRVQTGPFPSRDAAAKVCTQLKTRNQDCLVTQR